MTDKLPKIINKLIDNGMVLAWRVTKPSIKPAAIKNGTVLSNTFNPS